MGDRTTLSTFLLQNVEGNRRVCYAHVPGGGTTADLIVMPLSVIDYAGACFRSSVVTASSVQPSLSIDGSTINIFLNAATTGTAYTIKAEGH